MRFAGFVLLLLSCSSALSSWIPPSTEAILEIVLPKEEFKQATLSEIVTVIERESKKRDIHHKGIKIVLLSQKDFRLPEPNAITIKKVDIVLKKIAIYQALQYAAFLFNQKIKIVSDTVYYLPPDADFENFQRKGS
jgi:hypothetical protein